MIYRIRLSNGWFKVIKPFFCIIICTLFTILITDFIGIGRSEKLFGSRRKKERRRRRRR